MNIVMLKTSHIWPHPQNPRTDLGDIEELAASIKAMGILQNLTVVPYDPAVHQGLNIPNDGNAHYIAIAGHRRLAAAKKAKLTEVPAVISNMDLKTQVKIMLVENLQRETLSVYQQAKTIQLMLDLGDTVQDIAKQTGFSENTVRSRVKLAVFDPDKMAEVEGRPATIKDYLDLAKIEDEELRNEVLGSIGTANFRNDLARAKSTLRDRKNREEQISVLKSFATEAGTDAMNGKKFVRTLYSSDTPDKIVVPDDKDTVRYYFIPYAYSIGVYRDKTDADDMAENAREVRVAEIKEKSVAVKEATARAALLRKDFMLQMSATKVQKNLGAVVSAIGTQFLSLVRNGYTMIRLDHELLQSLTGLSLNAKKEVEIRDLQVAAKAAPEWVLFAVCVAMLEAGEQKYYAEEWISDGGYAYIHSKCEKLDRCYELLTALGYAMSDEEKQLQNGTHAKFYVKEVPQKSA